MSRPLKFTTDSNNSMGKSVSYGDTLPHTVVCTGVSGYSYVNAETVSLIVYTGVSGYSYVNAETEPYFMYRCFRIFVC